LFGLTGRAGQLTLARLEQARRRALGLGPFLDEDGEWAVLVDEYEAGPGGQLIVSPAPGL
jgi:hypothetical protein